MNNIFKHLSMAALALMGAIITGCSSSDDGIADTPKLPENTGKVVTLKTTVGFDDKAGTRALTANGVKTFAAGETMALGYYKYDSNTQTSAVSEPLTADDIAEDGKSATFTFRLTEAPDKTKNVKYIYPAAMATNSNVNYNRLYSQQDGTLTKLASDFDAASSDYLAWDGDNLPSDATLKNLLAILAITLKDDVTGADITSSITSLILSVGSYTYNVSRSAGDGPIYVAIRRTATEDHHSGSDINVTASDGIFTYTKTLKQKKYYTGNGYNVSWRMTNTMQSVPLTLEALTAGDIKVKDPQPGMKYSLNGGEKITMTETTTIENLNVGDKVQFYGNGQSITSYNGTKIAGGTAEVKVYGNIMSLVDEEGFATATTLTAEYTFSNLFSGNTALTDASGLLLPATTLANYCYWNMFYGCSSLTAAPALPAETLANSCYNSMFSGCKSLTDAPVLPATTLANYCYNGMFSGCSSLTTAPALPATTLANYCYWAMFSDCTSLTAAPALPATTLQPYCYDGMFAKCSSLTTAPALPAKKLANYCYWNMFYGCTNLSAVTCLATDISATDCTRDWLYGVAASGTFTTPSSTNWPSGPSGIPSGWTVKNYGQ